VSVDIRSQRGSQKSRRELSSGHPDSKLIFQNANQPRLNLDCPKSDLSTNQKIAALAASQNRIKLRCGTARLCQATAQIAPRWGRFVCSDGPNLTRTNLVTCLAGFFRTGQVLFGDADRRPPPDAQVLKSQSGCELFSNPSRPLSASAPRGKWLGATRARLGLLHGWARPVCLKGSGCAQFAEGDF
jgi:hypothetical protein